MVIKFQKFPKMAQRNFQTSNKMSRFIFFQIGHFKSQNVYKSALGDLEVDIFRILWGGPHGHENFGILDQKI